MRSFVRSSPRYILSSLPAALLVLVALSQLTGTGHAQNAESAKAFMDSVFADYRHQGKHLHPDTYYLTPSLRALVDDDNNAANKVSQMPVSGDGDLICNCQEMDGIWISKQSIRLTAPRHAEFTTTFALFQTPLPPNDSGSLRTMRYVLVFAGGQWRIDDIATLYPPPGSSLRADLLKDLKYFKNPEP